MPGRSEVSSYRSGESRRLVVARGDPVQHVVERLRLGWGLPVGGLGGVQFTHRGLLGDQVFSQFEQAAGGIHPGLDSGPLLER